MIYAQNNIIVNSSVYVPQFTYIPGIGPSAKITVINLSTNPVMLMLGEFTGQGQPPDWGDQDTAEMQIDGGFSSIVPVTPFNAWRLRAPNGNATVHFRVYA